MISVYESMIMRLIPEAVRTADEAARRNGWQMSGPDAPGSQKWNRVYHLTMDALCAQAGIRRLAYQGGADD